MLIATATEICGVMVVRSRRVADSRGSFSRWFCASELSAFTAGKPVVQVNQSFNASVGTVRGLHYQRSPHAETKLVRCLRGRIWDVALDLRKDSPTFLRWHAEVLQPEVDSMLVIPEGCAHGFQVLEADSEILYLHTAAYAKEFEGGVRYDEPRAAIQWPLSISQISARDAAHPRLNADFFGS